MFGFGFGGGGARDKEDEEDDGRPESTQSTPPWLKKQKVDEKDDNKENRQTNLVQSIRFVLKLQ